MLKLRDAQCCWGAWHLWVRLPDTQTMRDTAVHSGRWAGASGDAGGRPRALEQELLSAAVRCVERMGPESAKHGFMFHPDT